MMQYTDLAGMSRGGSDPQHDSYDPAFFEKLYKVEDRHFWFSARNKSITAVIGRLKKDLHRGYRVLEVGCGTGNVLRVLEQECTNGTLVGMDLFGEGLAFARSRTTCSLVQGDVHAPPFGIQFDIIGLFDVLEHLADDRAILHDVRRMLAPGGVLLLTVPAHMSLWSYFDEASHHCRRYEVSELKRKLAAAGYEVDYLTQYMLGIFPLVWVGRRVAALISKRSAKRGQNTDTMASTELRIVPVLNGALKWVLSLEAPVLSRRWHLPVGTSIIAVARKTTFVHDDELV